MSADHLILVRPATVDDLPAIHELIRASYAAMAEHAGPALAGAWSRDAEEVIERGDLSVDTFAEEHLRGPRALGFWVADHREVGVIGCVSLRRTTADEAQLTRMSVTASARGGGIGARLVEELVGFARRRGIHRIDLKTHNPRAARFYRTLGFAGLELAEGALTRFELTLPLDEPAGHP